MVTYHTGTTRKILCFSLVIILICAVFAGCGPQEAASAATDYSQAANWAYYEADSTDTKADVFFLCPTVYFGDEDNFHMSLTDEETKASFLGATNMEKGIYDAESRFFAPYYGQFGVNVFELDA